MKSVRRNRQARIARQKALARFNHAGKASQGRRAPASARAPIRAHDCASTIPQVRRLAPRNKRSMTEHVLSAAPPANVQLVSLAKPLSLALFGLGLGGLGVTALLQVDFALQWQPVPAEVPGREWLALANGVGMLLAGLALWSRRLRPTAAFCLAVYLAVWVIVLHTPRFVSGVEVAWLGMAEATAMASGMWAIAASSSARQSWPFGESGARMARLAFAVALPVFGLSHFLYADFTAAMVPAWMPQPLFWAYFTGAAHAAAGVGLLFGIFPRLAATLEAVMVTSFALLLHAPRVIAAPHERVEWTMLCIAAALAGAAWSIAASLRRIGR